MSEKESADRKVAEEQATASTAVAFEAGRKSAETAFFNKGFIAGVCFTCAIGWLFKAKG